MAEKFRILLDVLPFILNKTICLLQSTILVLLSTYYVLYQGSFPKSLREKQLNGTLKLEAEITIALFIGLPILGNKNTDTHLNFNFI